MRGLWECHVEHLDPGDFVKVECLSCGHVETLTAAMLRTGGVADLEQVRNLPRRLRCRERDAKGRADVSVRIAS
jgi:ribosomal protein S27E